MPKHGFHGKKAVIIDLLRTGKSPNEIIAITSYPPQYVYNITSIAKKSGLLANSTNAINVTNKIVDVLPTKTKQATIPPWISASTASRAFRLLDEGHPATDLVIILKLSPDDAHKIAKGYYDLRDISAQISKQTEEITPRKAEHKVEMSVEYAPGPFASHKTEGLWIYSIPANCQTQPAYVQKPAPPHELSIEEIVSEIIRAQGYALVVNALNSWFPN